MRDRDPARAPGPLLVAAIVYSLTTLAYALTSARAISLGHTQFNHFALLADAWLHGSLSLTSAPPAYAGGNDFAAYGGRWWVVFPAFPAALLVPFVKLAGGADRVRDGQIFLSLAGVAPAALYLALDRLRALGRSLLTPAESAGLAALFGLGTVYWFTAVQGTVWFAAHVVGAALAALYALCSLGASRPMLAGLCLGLGFWTRAPLLFAAPLFVLEAIHRSRGEPRAGLALARRLALFALPLGALLALAAWHNHARFGSPWEFGYRYLTISWQRRIETWGLFSFHYLPRNLGVLTSSLPFVNQAPGPAAAAWQLTHHGLALWVTTPLYLALLWPRRRTTLDWALWLTAACVALPSLFYQNTGQIQFGARFSNDYAPFLFLALAMGRLRLSRRLVAVGAIGVAVNLFGAVTFQRPRYQRYYTPTLQVYQPD